MKQPMDDEKFDFFLQGMALPLCLATSSWSRDNNLSKPGNEFFAVGHPLQEPRARGEREHIRRLILFPEAAIQPLDGAVVYQRYAKVVLTMGHRPGNSSDERNQRSGSNLDFRLPVEEKHNPCQLELGQSGIIIAQKWESYLSLLRGGKQLEVK
jgi:hypothetical protein